MDYLHTRKSIETCYHPRISEIILLGVQGGGGEYMKREKMWNMFLNTFFCLRGKDLKEYSRQLMLSIIFFCIFNKTYMK